MPVAHDGTHMQQKHNGNHLVKQINLLINQLLKLLSLRNITGIHTEYYSISL